MLGLFAFCGTVAIPAWFVNPLVAYVFLSLMMAVGTFGLLTSTALVENQWGKFGSAAAGAIARMSIATILVPAGVGLLVGIGGPIVLASVTAEIPDTAPAFVLDAEPAPLVQHLHVKEVI